MATTLTVHVGPPKTGSTSVQTALRRGRDVLAAKGILYPRTRRRDWNHNWCALDRAIRDRVLVARDAEVANYARHAYSFEGCWDRLVAMTREHDGPVLWSAEDFPLVPESDWRDLSRDLGGIPVKFVAVIRAVSRSLPSRYVENAKSRSVPDFEDYARSALSSLTAGQPDAVCRWHLDRLRGLSAELGWEWKTIAAQPDLNARVIADTIAAVVPGWRPRVPRTNRTLTALGVTQWRAAMASTRPRFAGAVRGALAWYVAAHPAVTRVDLGGRFALQPELAELVDRAFPVHDIRSADSAAAIATLRQRLATPGPLTSAPAISIPADDARWIATVAKLPRRLRAGDLAWRGVDVASVGVRRARPFRTPATVTAGNRADEQGYREKGSL